MGRSVCRITGMLSSCSLVSFVRRTNVTRLHRIDYTEHTWHKSQCTVETRSNRDTGPALCISTELFLVSLFLVLLFLPLPFTFGSSILPTVGGRPELDEMEAQIGWKISSRFVSRLLVDSGLKLEASDERISIVSFSGKFFVVFGLSDTSCKRVSRRNEETRRIHSRRIFSWCFEDLVDAEVGPEAGRQGISTRSFSRFGKIVSQMFDPGCMFPHGAANSDEVSGKHAANTICSSRQIWVVRFNEIDSAVRGWKMRALRGSIAS